MTKRLLLPLLALVLLLAAFQDVADPQPAPTVPPEQSSSSIDTAQVAASVGQPIWEENCARCHGANGLGTANGLPLPDLSLKSDQELLAVIAAGITEDAIEKMPAFAETLSPEDQAAALAYARLLQFAHGTGAAGSSEIEVAEIIGTVNGQITNGTAGSVAPPNQPITLHLLDSQGTETSFETTADASGVFTFTGVPLRADRSYVVDTVYNGISFTSALTPAVTGIDSLTLPVTVYESGAEPTVVTIDRLTQHVGVQDGELQVVQLIRFTNTSDRVFYTTADTLQTSVGVRIPQGAAFSDLMGGGYKVSADGAIVSESRPLIPGEPIAMHVVFVMPYSGTTSFQQTWDYAIAGQVEVMVGTDGLAVAAADLESRGPRAIGDTIFLTFGNEVQHAAGAPLNFEVSGTPVARPSTTAAAAPVVSPFAYIFIALGLGALVIAGALFIRERRDSGVLTDANGLIKQIADLDAKYQQGALKQSVYEKRRAELKAQLASLLSTSSQ